MKKKKLDGGPYIKIYYLFILILVYKIYYFLIYYLLYIFFYLMNSPLKFLYLFNFFTEIKNSFKIFFNNFRYLFSFPLKYVFFHNFLGFFFYNIFIIYFILLIQSILFIMSRHDDDDIVETVWSCLSLVITKMAIHNVAVAIGDSLAASKGSISIIATFIAFNSKIIALP